MKRVAFAALAASWLLLIGCGGGGGGNNNVIQSKEWIGVQKVDNLAPNKRIKNYSSFKGLSVNKNGDAAVIWQQAETTNVDVFVRFYNFNSNSWSSPIKINTYNLNVYKSKIYINDDGDAFAVWVQQDNNGHLSLYLRAYDKSTNSWLPLKLIETKSTDVENFDIAGSGKRLALSWIQKDGAYKKCFAVGYDIRVNNIGTITAQSIANHDAVYSKVGLDANGNILLVWKQKISGTLYNLYAKTYDNSTTTWSGTTLLENLSNPPIALAVDMNNNGDGAIAWIQNDGTHINTYFSFYNHTANSFSSARVVDTLDGLVSQAAVAINEKSNVAIAWIQKDNSGHYNSYFRKYIKSTNSFSNVELVENINDNQNFAINTDIDKNGNAVVAWMQKDDNNHFSIFANYYDAQSSSWSGGEALENVNNMAFSPSVKMDENGNVVAVWQQQNSLSKEHLYSNIYR